jgi:ribosomal protein S18 acetylase RimI-like enzyme
MRAESGIRRLRGNEWREFRALRLEALKTDPLAFGSTVGHELSYTDEKWQTWCQAGAAGKLEATFVAAGSAGELRGMAGAFIVEGVVHIWGMWVRPEARRQGLARQLLEEVLAWVARSHPGLRVVLDVNPSQDSAVRLYAARGFEFNGVEAPLGHHPPAVARQMALRR